MEGFEARSPAWFFRDQRRTTRVEAFLDVISDRGSTPLTSTNKTREIIAGFLYLDITSLGFSNFVVTPHPLRNWGGFDILIGIRAQ